MSSNVTRTTKGTSEKQKATSSVLRRPPSRTPNNPRTADPIDTLDPLSPMFRDVLPNLDPAHARALVSHLRTLKAHAMKKNSSATRTIFHRHGLFIKALARYPYTGRNNSITKAHNHHPNGYTTEDCMVWCSVHDPIGLHRTNQNTAGELLCLLFGFWEVRIPAFEKKFGWNPTLEGLEEVEREKKVFQSGCVVTMEDAFCYEEMEESFDRTVV